MAMVSDWLQAAPLVIAHRGASFLAPENTGAAFELARRLGADAIELDAKRTLDGHVVCFHDRTLERTTGASGSVGRSTLAALRYLDAGSWKGEAFAGERIPTLAEVLDLAKGSLLVNVELTDYWGDQAKLVEQAAAVVSRGAAEARVLFSSFQSGALVAAQRLAPHIPRAHLVGPTWLAYRDRLVWRRADVQAVHPHASLARADRIAAAHRAGRRVHVYTVNDSEGMARLWEMGVDGLISDLPDVARMARDGP
jgi:glycerophosphoryl diester phosphodiesterase